MANTVTPLGQIPAGVVNCGDSVRTRAYRVEIDTVDTEVEVHTPHTDEMRWALLGLLYVNAAAHQLTIMSGAVELVTMDIAANSGIVHPLGNGLLCSGADKNEKLIIKSSVAIPSMLVYAQDYKYLRL